MSRTPAYSAFRIVGATFTLTVSAMWLTERLFHVQTHVDAVVDFIAHRGQVCAGILFAASLASLLFAKR